MSNKPILVIGARGKTGSRVVERLEAAGYAVRKGSRSSETPFDWENAATWAPAFEGVQSAYVTYYPDLASPAARDKIETLCAIARTAGVSKIVLLSGRGETGAQACEEVVRQSGLDYTLVRAAWFAQNYSEGYMHDQVMKGFVALPAGKVREAIVDIDDIADVVFAALTDPRHSRQEYDVTGPRLMTFGEMADTLALTVGRPVIYVPLSLKTFHAAVKKEAGPELADIFTEVCRETLDGRNEKLGDGVRRALGRAPRDFADFCATAGRQGVWGKPHTVPKPNYIAMVLLGLAGLVALGIGGAIVASPPGFYAGYGVDLPADAGLLNELRGSGAGVAGIGLFLLLGAIRPRLTLAAAILGAIVNLGYAGGRALAYVLDGHPGDSFLAAGAGELGLGIMCLVALWLSSRKK